MIFTNFISAQDLSNISSRTVPQLPLVMSTKAGEHADSAPVISLQYDPKTSLLRFFFLAPAEGKNDCGHAMWAVLYHCGKVDGLPAP